MIIKQQLYQVKCDHCGKVSPAGFDDKMPDGWIRTSIGDDCHKVFVIDYKGRQMACVEGAKHFCSLSCFLNYIQKQIDNYLTLVESTMNKEA